MKIEIRDMLGLIISAVIFPASVDSKAVTNGFSLVVNHFLLQLTRSHIRVSIILFILSIYYASFLSAYKEQCHLSIFDRSDTHKKRKSF